MEPKDFDIRFSEYDDIAYVSSWLEEDFQGFPFSESEKGDSLKVWLGYSKYKASLTGMIGSTPCAVGTLFLMPYKKVAHHASFYLIVDPKQRRQGIGTSMVRNLLHLAKTRFKLESVHAELYLPSPIENILREQKFEEFARQEHFVKVDGKYQDRLLLEHFFV